MRSGAMGRYPRGTRVSPKAIGESVRVGRYAGAGAEPDNVPLDDLTTRFGIFAALSAVNVPECYRARVERDVIRAGSDQANAARALARSSVATTSLIPPNVVYSNSMLTFAAANWRA